MFQLPKSLWPASKLWVPQKSLGNDGFFQRSWPRECCKQWAPPNSIHTWNRSSRTKPSDHPIRICWAAIYILQFKFQKVLIAVVVLFFETFPELLSQRLWPIHQKNNYSHSLLSCSWCRSWFRSLEQTVDSWDFYARLKSVCTWKI